MPKLITPIVTNIDTNLSPNNGSANIDKAASPVMIPKINSGSQPSILFFFIVIAK